MTESRDNDWQNMGLRERVTRLEEQMKESKADRTLLHLHEGVAFGRLDVLEDDVMRAKTVLWVAGLAGSIIGFLAGVLQPWIGLHR